VASRVLEQGQRQPTKFCGSFCVHLNVVLEGSQLSIVVLFINVDTKSFPMDDCKVASLLQS
jgi:hypothetical protein